MKIASEFIKLDSFLKVADVVSSGGEAKLLVLAGGVKVNGSVELRRGRKLVAGDRVEVNGKGYLVE